MTFYQTLFVGLSNRKTLGKVYVYFLLSTSSPRSLVPLDKVERKSDFVASRLACIV